jgi:hypothetical protein
VCAWASDPALEYPNPRVQETIVEIVIPIVVIAIIAGVFLVLRSRNAAGEAGGQAPWGPGAGKPTEPLRQPTVDDLRPGDAISFWDGSDDVVESVVVCREELGGRGSSWRWNVLTSGRVVETAPDANVLYTTITVLQQGSEPYYSLTADPEAGGALKAFEARVRDQSIGRNPVGVALLDKQWTVESTGTFSATYVGPPPKGEVWRDISTTPADNVYFELHTADGDLALGIWTSHILILEGRALEGTDIQNLYPGSTEVH